MALSSPYSPNPTTSSKVDPYSYRIHPDVSISSSLLRKETQAHTILLLCPPEESCGYQERLFGRLAIIKLDTESRRLRFVFILCLSQVAERVLSMFHL